MDLYLYLSTKAQEGSIGCSGCWAPCKRLPMFTSLCLSEAELMFNLESEVHKNKTHTNTIRRSSLYRAGVWRSFKQMLFFTPMITIVRVSVLFYKQTYYYLAKKEKKTNRNYAIVKRTFIGWGHDHLHTLTHTHKILAALFTVSHPPLSSPDRFSPLTAKQTIITFIFALEQGKESFTKLKTDMCHGTNR